MFNKNIFSYFVRMWDPRPKLASVWLESAEKYEERLRANKSLSSQVIEAILQERNRIRTLFNELLPEFRERISVVITADAAAENCAVFLWDGHLYVLVSAALIGRPFDCPEDAGVKAWEWLARHEAAHIRGGHLRWFFHTRRLFRMALNFFAVFAIFFSMFYAGENGYSYLLLGLWILGGVWSLQTFVGLAFECNADFSANKSINDPAVLKEAEKCLYRMRLQAKSRWLFPFGWLNYILSSVLVDPHPPLAFRVWLLRRRLRALKTSLLSH